LNLKKPLALCFDSNEILQLEESQGWIKGGLLRRCSYFHYCLHKLWFSNLFFFGQGKLIVLDKDGKKQFYDLGRRIDAALLAKVEGYRFPLDSEWEYAAKVRPRSRHF
jgi:hypothetical protein